MNNSLAFLGVGEIIYDHCFHTQDNITRYIDSRGGGSVWNILSNLSAYNLKCYAIAAYGNNNPYGNLAIEELQNLGINTQFCESIRNKSSRLIFQELITINNYHIKHEFTDRCIICGNRPEDNLIVKYKSGKNNVLINFNDIYSIILDKITVDRIELIKYAKSLNPKIIVILDFGRIGYLRYIPTPQIIDQLNLVDVVFINNSALLSLKKRLVRFNQTDAKVNDLFLTNGSLKYIIETKGEKGSILYIKDKLESILISPTQANVLDTSGAGDAYLAAFIKLLYLKKVDLDNIQDVESSLLKAKDEISIVLETFGARGHLPKVHNNDLKNFVSKTTNEIKNEIKNEIINQSICPFCFSSLIKKNIENNKIKRPTHSYNKTMAYLSDRILFAIERKDLLEKCYSLAKNISSSYIVGTGGSYSTACYLSQFLMTEVGKISIPIKPFDYISQEIPITEALFIISYSGSSPDYLPVIDKAINKGISKIILISRPKKPKLWSYIISKRGIFYSDVLINYAGDNSQKERGFVSITGTIIPCLLFYFSFNKSQNARNEFFDLNKKIKEKKYNNLIEFALNLKQSPIIELFGGGYSWPAILDLESKLTEGAISGSILHEFKDFSHGRFMYSMKNKNPKIILIVEQNEYIQKLIKNINDNEVPLLIIKSENKGILGALELMLEVQYFVYKLAKEMYNGKHDISKPKNIPSKGLELYRWKFTV